MTNRPGPMPDVESKATEAAPGSAADSQHEDNAGNAGSPPGPGRSADASVSTASHIDRICTQFEQALSRAIREGGPRPQIEEHLGRVPADHRDDVFRELLALEMELRLQGGESPVPSDYRDFFPSREEVIDEIYLQVTKSRRLGNYLLLESLGEGGMGVVWRARQVMLGQTVALKVMHDHIADRPHLVARFRREMRNIGELPDHPNLVKAHYAGEAEGKLFLVMEYLPGSDLRALIERSGPMPLGAACAVMRQAAAGLGHGHDHGLVHRDIKPGNLMLGKNGVVKILDLGLARLRGAIPGSSGEEGDLTYTQPGTILGSLDYMAPEQWWDPSGVDHRADIYALGCTFFHVLTGEVPYGRPDFSTQDQKRQAHAEAPVPRLSDRGCECPKEIEDLVAQMMAKQPHERPSDLGVVYDQIDPFANDDQLDEWAAACGSTSETFVIDSDEKGDSSKPRSGQAGSRGSRSGRSSGGRSARGVGGSTNRTMAASTLSDRPLVPQAWYKNPLAVAGMLLAIAVGGMGLLWVTGIFPTRTVDPLAQELASEIGTQPGPNGGWWFEETPWFSPSVRRQLIEDLRRGQAIGLPTGRVHENLRSADFRAAVGDLQSLLKQAKPRLSGIAGEAARQLALFNPDDNQFDQNAYHAELAKLLVKLADASDPTVAHVRGAIAHYLAREGESGGDYAVAQASYEQALDGYESAGDDLSSLAALARADLALLLTERGNYADAAVELERAVVANDSPVFRTYCHTLEADAFRRMRNLSRSQAAVDAGRAAAEPLDSQHPLRAALLEREALAAIPAWRFTKAKSRLDDATAIRRANRDAGNLRSYREVLFNEQLTAWCDHYLGNQAAAASKYQELLSDISESLKQGFIRRDLTPKQRLEIRDRRPNLHDRWSDCYLYGNAGDGQTELSTLAAKALVQIDEAIKFAKDYNFDDQSQRWPFVAALRYKAVAAELLIGGEAAVERAAERMKEADEIVATKHDLPQFGQMQRIFRGEQELALALTNLAEETAEENRRGHAALVKAITSINDPASMDPRRAEAFLLAVELVAAHPLTSAETLGRVARKLLALAEAAHNTPDGEMITSRYLRRYLQATHDALAQLNSETQPFENELYRLAQLLEP